MTSIYLIRHAQAEGNYFLRAQGTYDSNLTFLGKRQLKYLAGRFATVPLCAVYASPLRRAYKTAQAVADLHALPVIPEAGLIEECCGQWEDVPWGNLQRFDAADMEAYNNDPLRWSTPGIEPGPDAQRRIADTVKRLGSAHDGETIALFSHGGVLRLLMAYIENIPSEKIRWTEKGDNTGVTLVELHGDTLKLIYEGDNSHLPEDCSSLKMKREDAWLGGEQKAFSPWLRPWDPAGDRALYLRLCRDTWRAAHGAVSCDVEPYYERAAQRSRENPKSVMVAVQDETPYGVIELCDDPGAGAKHIAFLAVDAPYRGKGMSPCLMGEAISACRRAGWEKLRLRVAPTNEHAVGYYTHLGFQKVDTVPGAAGMQDIMEWNIEE